jgi:hypothetical protein
LLKLARRIALYIEIFLDVNVGLGLEIQNMGL